MHEYWKEIKASTITCNALNPLQCPLTDLNWHKRNIPQPFPFTIRVALFSLMYFNLLLPKLYKIKYKPKSSMDMKDQTLGVLKSEGK